MVSPRQKTVVVGAGPVGSLAALYAANRGDDVELYELRGGTLPALKTVMEKFWSYPIYKTHSSSEDGTNVCINEADL